MNRASHAAKAWRSKVMYRALRVIELFLWAQGESIRMGKDIEKAKGDASALLFFQDVNAGKGESLVICFASRWQLEFAAARGDTAILLDATHSTNQLKVCLSSFGPFQKEQVLYFFRSQEF